ncbi:LysM peptidoglycan-binding domain-containing protein [Lactiplantibacillus plantarum]|uniref:LysM peptidoglycan-binding domain-containing protein n=1 Tax=Lactiplantibacillus plantarum TaxID=1590 RepID=UPI001BAAA45E|nr:LysM peptidoglycan-binding domain-containing protein [Lactiplantibacillus plantarum]MBS0953574.1 LysM peptidoglycan-binding domain-containing protein [Lactiplantibacillus plantarum]
MKIKNLVLSSTAALALFTVSAKVANADNVTVKAGDTVSSIANANHTSVDAIKNANHLSNINLIFVGDKLEVNGTTDAQTTTSSVATTQAPKTTSQATTASSVATSQAPKTASQATTASSVVTSQAPKTASQATTASSVATSQAPKTTNQATVTSTTANNGASSQSEVLSQMQSRTGVSAATWNRIITRESNWNNTVRNSTSGAYGLFQNMHISSGSVQDQVNAAVSLYHSQGMSAWGE